MSEYTYKMQANILAAQVKQLELSLTTMRKEIDSLWFERKKLIGALVMAATEWHFMETAINAQDPPSELLLRCKDARKRILAALAEVNTNETIEHEIPAEWDVSVQAAERRGYRAGAKALKNYLLKTGLLYTWDEVEDATDKLLAEREKK